jgi:hypothetical protein
VGGLVNSRRCPPPPPKYGVALPDCAAPPPPIECPAPYGTPTRTACRLRATRPACPVPRGPCAAGVLSAPAPPAPTPPQTGQPACRAPRAPSAPPSQWGSATAPRVAWACTATVRDCGHPAPRVASPPSRTPRRPRGSAVGCARPAGPQSGGSVSTWLCPRGCAVCVCHGVLRALGMCTWVSPLVLWWLHGLVFFCACSCAMHPPPPTFIDVCCSLFAGVCVSILLAPSVHVRVGVHGCMWVCVCVAGTAPLVPCHLFCLTQGA